MKYQIKLTSACALALCMIAGSASAALVDNGNSMIDSGTGLEWLDLTETQGLSWNQAEASIYVTAQGFVHADAAQVTTLFLNAGFLTTDNVNNTANDPAAALLLSTMGCTQFCGTNFETGRGFADNGAFKTRPNYHAGPLGAGAAVISLQTNNLDLVDTTAGHFLVRAVPVPAAVWLFGSALGLLGWFRSKKS